MGFGRDTQLTSLGYEQLTVSTTAVALASVPARARRALVVLDATNGVRWRDDGGNPTAAIGMPLAGGGVLEFEGVLASLRLIRSGGADAVANVTYYD